MSDALSCAKVSGKRRFRPQLRMVVLATLDADTLVRTVIDRDISDGSRQTCWTNINSFYSERRQTPWRSTVSEVRAVVDRMLETGELIELTKTARGFQRGFYEVSETYRPATRPGEATSDREPQAPRSTLSPQEQAYRAFRESLGELVVPEIALRFNRELEVLR
jgi:hypothetical protein